MGRYTDDRDALPLGSVVEMPCTAAVVGDFVRTGEVLLKSEWPQLNAAVNTAPAYEGLTVSGNPSPAVGAPRYPFVMNGQTYYTSSGTGLYQLYDNDKFKSVATIGLPAGAGRVAVLAGVAYCVVNNDLYKSADVLTWEAVIDSAWYLPTELLGATSTDLYFRATQVGGSSRIYKMNGTTKAFSLLTLPATINHNNGLYPDGDVLVATTGSGSPIALRVSRDGGVTWEDHKTLPVINCGVFKNDDGTVAVGAAGGIISNQSTLHLSNDGWVTSFAWTLISPQVQSVCKIGNKFAGLYWSSASQPVYIHSVSAASTGTVNTLDTDTVGTQTTNADEIPNNQAGVLYVVNGKLTIAYAEATLSFPAASTGNDLILPAVAGRTVRPLPSTPVAVLIDGRVLTCGNGFFCVYDPDTGLFSGPGRIVGTAEFRAVAGPSQYIRGVALIKGDIFIYSENGTSSANSVNCFVLTAAGAVQQITVPYSALMYNPCVIQQLAEDCVIAFSISGSAVVSALEKSTTGRYFTAITSVTMTNTVINTYAITKNKALVLFDTNFVYTTRDFGKSWTKSALPTGTLLDVSDKGFVMTPTSTTRQVLYSLDTGAQIGADLPAGSYSTGATAFRNFELPGDLRLLIGSTTTLRKGTNIFGSSSDVNSAAKELSTVLVMPDGTFRAVSIGTQAPYGVFTVGKQKGRWNKTTQFQVPEITPVNAQLNAYVKGR